MYNLEYQNATDRIVSSTQGSGLDNLHPDNLLNNKVGLPKNTAIFSQYAAETNGLIVGTQSNSDQSNNNDKDNGRCSE